MPRKRIKRRRKIKYKSISLKISAKQHDVIKVYCAKYKLTPNKVIKKALRVYLERFGPVIDNQTAKIGKNQLTIFDAGADEADSAVSESEKIREELT